MNDEIFTPERVDEQIEQNLSFSRSGQFARDPGERVVQRLHALYEEDMLATAHVWERLIRQESRWNIAAQPTEIMQALPRERSLLEPLSPANLPRRQKKYTSRVSAFSRRVSLFAAVLVLAFLVGSLIFVLQAAHPSTSVVTGKPGQTVYSLTRDPEGQPFVDLAWSPDSQRVALLTTGGLQIWDATTGANKVTAHLPADMLDAFIMGSLPATGDSSYLSARLPASGGGGANIRVLAWSPDGKWIAVSGMGPELAIVNAQTGALAHYFNLASSTGVVTENLPTTGSSTLLSAHMPASGGGGPTISGLAWSPNSQQLAVTVVADRLNGSLSLNIVNAQSGTLAHHLTISSGADVLNWAGVASWSPDGKYLAAHVIRESQVLSTVWVWDTSNYQVVFKQDGGVQAGGTFEYGDQLAWQPHTNNLVFAVGEGTGKLFTIKVELWDIAKHTMLQQYPVISLGQFAWSPNGTYLAVVTAYNPSVYHGQWITVLNATSGHPVYNYKQQTGHIAALAWSPDGKYIVSCDESTVKVWVAP